MNHYMVLRLKYTYSVKTEDFRKYNRKKGAEDECKHNQLDFLLAFELN